MKKLSYILLFFLITGAISCKKNDNEESVQPENYSFSADRNSEKWSGITEIQLQAPDADTLTILFIANKSSEILWTKIKFNGIGAYPLKGGQAGYYTLVGGDVYSTRYRIPSGETSQLNITHYNPTQKLIEGTFNISLEKEYANPDNNIDLLNFENGKFKWKLTR